MMEIIPGVFRINLTVSNCFLIDEADGLTLIDAGVSRSFQPLVQFIESLGRSPQQLNTILLSHADLDHVGAASALRDFCGAQVLTSQVEADALAEGHSSRPIQAGFLTPFFQQMERDHGAMRVEVDRVLVEGETLPVLGGLQVIASPGHTPGHLSFYAPRHRLLFAGDSVSTRYGTVRYNPVKMFNWDMAQMRESVHRQAAMCPEIVCSGHGPPVFKAASKFPSR